MMESMLLSVIVPVYNVDKYLCKCLDSILCQDVPNMEIICVDDCSEDNSLSILKEYKTNDNRIIIVEHNVNLGLSCARNTGLEKAIGQYILFVDSDDYLKEDCLKDLLFYAQNSELDILYYQYKRFEDETGAIIDEHQMGRYSEYYDVLTGREHFVYMELEKSLTVMAWQGLYSRKFLISNDIRFPVGMKHEDYLFTFKCLDNASKVLGIENVIYLYRKRNDSITGNVDKKNVTDLLMILNQIIFCWNDIDCSRDMNRAMNRFCRTILSSYIEKKRLAKVDLIEPQMKLTGKRADIFIHDVITYGYDGVNRYASFDDKDIIQISNASHIYIYGAGKVGCDVFDYLKKMEICMDTVEFVQTSVENELRVWGKKVISIYDLVFQNDDLIIIGVVPNKQKEIKSILLGMGYSNYICAG